MKWPDAIAAYIRDRTAVRPMQQREHRAALSRVPELPSRGRHRSQPASHRSRGREAHASPGGTGTGRCNRHSVLISFYDWLLQEGHRKDNPARQVRRTRLTHPSVYRLTRTEAAAMMDACETPRERRAIYIGLLTGARVGELAALQIRHLERPGWVWFSEDIAKGKKERWVPVLPELVPIIAETIENIPALSFAIPSKGQTTARLRGKAPEPISRSAISLIIKTVGKRAGIAANIHPHLLRHSFGDHIAKHAGLRVAQALMGHMSVETTARVYVDRPALDELALHVQGFRYRSDVATTTEGGK